MNNSKEYMVLDEFGTHCCVSSCLDTCLKIAKDLANNQNKTWYVGDKFSIEKVIEVKPDKNI